MNSARAWFPTELKGFASLWDFSVDLKVPRAILSTLIIRMMVGLMGRAALISISSRVIPITDRSTMARSSWFHLKQTHLGVAEGAAACELPRYRCSALGFFTVMYCNSAMPVLMIHSS